MHAAWHCAGALDKLAETGAPTEEPKANLGAAQGGQGIQQRLRIIDAPVSVLSAVGAGYYW